MNNLMQLCELAGTMVIYKYIPLKYILTTLQSGKLAFKRISEWDDVYENYAYKNQYQLNDGRILQTAEEMQSRLFGQSWTDAQETDAMWRIYSHPEKSLNDSAARVATTIGKIKMVLKEQNYVINRVNYLPQSNIEHISSLTVGELQQFLRDSSFCKRIEFQHEQETRIVVENESVKDDLLSIQIPTDFFDEYLLDPRLTSEQEAEIRSILEAEKVPSKKIKNLNYTNSIFKPYKY